MCVYAYGLTYACININGSTETKLKLQSLEIFSSNLANLLREKKAHGLGRDSGQGSARTPAIGTSLMRFHDFFVCLIILYFHVFSRSVLFPSFSNNQQ